MLSRDLILRFDCEQCTKFKFGTSQELITVKLSIRDRLWLYITRPIVLRKKLHYFTFLSPKEGKRFGKRNPISFWNTVADPETTQRGKIDHFLTDFTGSATGVRFTLDNAISDAVKFTKPPDWGFRDGASFYQSDCAIRNVFYLIGHPHAPSPEILSPVGLRNAFFSILAYYTSTCSLRLLSHEASSMVSNADKQGRFTFASLFVPIRSESKKQIKSDFHIDAYVKKNSLQDCSHCILHVDIFLTSSISAISPSQSQKISNNCFRIIVFHCGEPNF